MFYEYTRLQGRSNGSSIPFRLSLWSNGDGGKSNKKKANKSHLETPRDAWTGGGEDGSGSEERNMKGGEQSSEMWSGQVVPNSRPADVDGAGAGR